MTENLPFGSKYNVVLSLVNVWLGFLQNAWCSTFPSKILFFKHDESMLKQLALAWLNTWRAKEYQFSFTSSQDVCSHTFPLGIQCISLANESVLRLYLCNEYYLSCFSLQDLFFPSFR